MRLKKLGNSDLMISPFCLGTMTFGEQTSENDAHMQIDLSIDSGINFIDTAEMYPTCPTKKSTQGNTEKIIGNWIKKNKSYRNKIVLATKVIGNGYNKIRDGGPITPKIIKIAVEKSLNRLKTDYIDLYQLHWPNRGSYHFRQNWNYDPSSQKTKPIISEIELLVDTLFKLKKEGKIRAFGLSNETSWGTMQFVLATKKYNDFNVVSIQNEYSLLCRHFDTDLSELSHNENIPLLAYSPLAAGLLTGKYINNKIPKNSRLSRVHDLGGRFNSRTILAIKEYLNLSKQHNLELIELALAFCNQRKFMGSVIFGSTSLKQLKLILSAIKLKINEKVINEINSIYKNNPLTF
jgi:aryl-alcohol dehydrogenase-like predicted oxidoreductase